MSELLEEYMSSYGVSTWCRNRRTARQGVPSDRNNIGRVLRTSVWRCRKHRKPDGQADKAVDQRQQELPVPMTAPLPLPLQSKARPHQRTQHIPLSQAQAGGLVFFHSTYNAGTYVTHVGIVVSPTQMYHAGSSGIGYADLTSSYYQQHLIGAGRIKQ